LHVRTFSSPHQIAAAGAFILAIAFLSVPYLIRERAAGQTSSLAWPDKALLSVAAFTFLALFSEGTMADWSGVYLQTVIGVPVSTAALGYAAYSLAMAGGRFLGDRLLSALGPILLLRFSGLSAADGLALALLIRRPEVVIAGFILVGFGLSNIVPILFGSAGRHKAGVGPGIAAVTTIGYFGFLRAAEFAPFLFLTLPAGVWADLGIRKRLMISSNLIRAMIIVCVPLAIALGWARLEVLYLVMLLMGSFKVIFEMAYQTYIPEIKKRPWRRSSKTFSSRSSTASGSLPVNAISARFSGWLP
jgi:Transmembrane secretion effector